MKKLLLCFVLLFGMTLVSAVPPIDTYFIGNEGYDVQANVQDYYKINEGAQVHIYVFNFSTGELLSSPVVSCGVELTDSNGTELLSGSATAEGNHFHMSRPSNIVTEEGSYALTIVCNGSTLGGYKTNFFEANENGEEEKEGIVIIVFSLLFIFLCFEMLGLLLWTLLHFLELNLDAKDLILNVSSYFALFAFYILQIRFVGDVFMSDFSLFLIEVGAVTAVIIPIIGFFVSYIKQNTTKGDHN